MALLAVGTFVMRQELGGVAWLFFGVALAGILILAVCRSEDSEAKEVDEAFRVAEEAIKREAQRLDARRAEIEKVLLAYGEWMEFPDFRELQEIEWATPERSAEDAEVAGLLDREADRMLEKFSNGAYWEGGQLQSRMLLLELWEFMESIARVYHPESERPILETNLEALLKAVNRASIQIILMLEEVPLIEVKNLNVRQVSEAVRKASKVVRKYSDLQPILSPVRYLWQGSKFLLAANPLLAAGWVAGSELLVRGGKKFGKRALDGYLLSMVRQTLGIVAWETASIYDRTHRYRDPDWVYAVELAHLVSEFPLTRDGLREALKELSATPLRSGYDRIFLYRCVVQHVSPKPERFAQSDLLTEETRRMIGERLHKFCSEQVEGVKERKLNSWRKGVGKRLGIKFSPANGEETETETEAAPAEE